MTAMLTTDIAIEQARARGLTLEQAATQLGVKPKRVRAVWARMGATAAVEDVSYNPETRARRARRAP